MPDNQHSNPTASGPYRRDLMKALGAGTAVGLLGGVASAGEQAEDQADSPGVTAVSQTTPMEGTVHVVRTLISQATNPERPADFFFHPTGIHVEPGDVIKFVFETPDHNVTSYHPSFGMQRRIPAGVQPFSSPVMGWDPASLPDDVEMPPAEPGGEGEEAGDGEGEEAGDGEGEGDEQTGGESQGEEMTEGAPRPSSWLHSFETPGVYDIECAPHEGFGMAMRVVVGEETETAFETSNPENLPQPRAGPVGFARQVLTDPNLEPDAIVEEGRVEWTALEMNQESETGGGGGDEGNENGDS